MEENKIIHVNTIKNIIYFGIPNLMRNLIYYLTCDAESSSIMTST